MKIYNSKMNKWVKMSNKELERFNSITLYKINKFNKAVSKGIKRMKKWR